MAPPNDPYRTLGLSPGATTTEIKAAYRRLVKTFHPDAAGEKAIARFLAIQAAYDALTSSGRRNGRSAAAREPAREPWRADPSRAWATPGATRPTGRSQPGGGDTKGNGRGATPGRGGSGAEATGRRRDGSASRRPQSEQPKASGTSPSAGTQARRERSTRRATPGSTSYDSAGEPFNPEWSGASWYGTTSGTYWTINPKEYADPRKHGPEYQARARRAWTGRADAEGEGAGEFDPVADEFVTDSAGDRAAPGPTAAFRPADARRSDRESTGSGEQDSGVDLLTAIRSPSGLPGRAATALLGWPPLGVAFAALLSETSGCGRFAASCVDTFDLGTWAGQLAIIGLLLALPRLASISAFGTLAMLTASVPGAIFLSAAGGAQDQDTAASVLTVVLVVAYGVGVLLAVGRGLRTMRS